MYHSASFFLLTPTSPLHGSSLVLKYATTATAIYFVISGCSAVIIIFRLWMMLESPSRRIGKDATPQQVDEHLKWVVGKGEGYSRSK